MYKLVIFDLDGTLLNTLGDLAAAGNHALSMLGFPVHEVNAYKHFVGNGIPNLISRILPAEEQDRHEQCFQLFNEYYSAHKIDLTVPYDGITELLKKLSEKGVICCCNTNKAQDFASQLINGFFGDSIKAVIGQGGGYALKPAPDAAEELMRRYGISKENALYVGDSNVDMKTAAAAGISACGVLWGFRDYEELSGCSPAYIVENVGELEKIILGL